LPISLKEKAPILKKKVPMRLTIKQKEALRKEKNCRVEQNGKTRASYGKDCYAVYPSG